MTNIENEAAASAIETGSRQETETPANFVDLSGEICPMTYVKFKLYMNKISDGELLEILLNEGEHMKNVPEHIREEGHKIENTTQVGDKYRLLVRKVG